MFTTSETCDEHPIANYAGKNIMMGRQKQALIGAARGLTAAGTAAQTDIMPETVRKYRRMAMARHKSSTITQAVALALLNGEITFHEVFPDLASERLMLMERDPMSPVRVAPSPEQNAPYSTWERSDVVDA